MTGEEVAAIYAKAMANVVKTLLEEPLPGVPIAPIALALQAQLLLAASRTGTSRQAEPLVQWLGQVGLSIGEHREAHLDLVLAETKAILDRHAHDGEGQSPVRSGG